jgi:hypothetical protein
MKLGEHGSRLRYQHGCRCCECRAGNAEYMRQHRRGVCGTHVTPVDAEARREAMERLARQASGTVWVD